MKNFANELKTTHLIKMHRKYIARLNTFLSAVK
jgi:ribosomal protein L29